MKAEAVEKVHEGERGPVLRTIADQYREVKDVDARVTCPCGNELPLVEAFRCLYCEVWFCLGCAEEHFGGEDA